MLLEFRFLTLISSFVFATEIRLPALITAWALLIVHAMSANKIRIVFYIIFFWLSLGMNNIVGQ